MEMGRGMTMKPKEYLQQYQTLKYEYREARDYLQALRTDAETVAGIRYDKDKIQSSNQTDLSDIVVHIMKAEEHLREAYIRCLQKMIEIRRVIDGVEDPRARELLKRRYIAGQSFGEIQEEMAYEAGTIYNYHGKALLLVKIPASDEKK